MIGRGSLNFLHIDRIKSEPIKIPKIRILLVEISMAGLKFTGRKASLLSNVLKPEFEYCQSLAINQRQTKKETMAKIFVSSVINAPIEGIWVKTRDFNALPSWHPEVEESHIENKEPSDKVGCIRNFRLKDGSKIREKLLALTDIENLCTYSILESPMEVENYVATMRFLPITDGNQTYAEWTAEFNCPPREEEGLIELISGAVFQGGFDALKQSFAV